MKLNKPYVGARRDVPFIVPIIQDKFKFWLKQQQNNVKNWIEVNNFTGKPGSFCLLPNSAGELEKVLLGIENSDDFWSFAILPNELPESDYKIENNFNNKQLEQIAIAWKLGCYSFNVYKKDIQKSKAKLVFPLNFNSTLSENIVNSIYLVRDLINYPANSMGPTALAEEADKIATKFKAKITHTVGTDLLKNNYNAIHAVGRASVDAPRLIEMRWGNAKNPKITLVGKGVCFDSGGLDLKPAAAMKMMKKDMGGAAHVLGLANMIMAANLPVNLRVLIPAVENMVAANSFKPGDVITTYQGITVEITNTDAEGRLILADALTLACEDDPALLIDFATLTGAGKVALGTEIASMFGNNNVIIKKLVKFAQQEQDPIWQMPIYSGYSDMLDSNIADMVNSTEVPYAGAITAALFLQKFVKNGISWLHFDIMGSNLKDRPGRPIGGEAQGIRAVFSYLLNEYGSGKG